MRFGVGLLVAEWSLAEWSLAEWRSAEARIHRREVEGDAAEAGGGWNEEEAH